MRKSLQNFTVDLSIIILNYNTKELTLECIDSIKNSGFGGTYEIIAVDNASTDGSAQALGRLKGITLIKNPQNLGFAKANNRGIKLATGRHVLLLNSDTKVKKGALDELVRFADAKPDAGVVGARLLNIDGTAQPSVFHFPTIARAFKEYWLGQKGAYELYVPQDDEPVQVESVVGAAFLITPAAREKVGLLDERYFMYFEDLDYCRRTRRAGLAVYYLPAAEILHYHGASGKDIVKPAYQWRRLIPSSKIYHGTLRHYLINFILWTGQKLRS